MVVTVAMATVMMVAEVMATHMMEATMATATVVAGLADRRSGTVRHASAWFGVARGCVDCVRLCVRLCTVRNASCTLGWIAMPLQTASQSANSSSRSPPCLWYTSLSCRTRSALCTTTWYAPHSPYGVLVVVIPDFVWWLFAAACERGGRAQHHEVPGVHVV